VNRQCVALTGAQSNKASIRDHSRVVRAEFGPRVEDLDVHGLGHASQSRADATIGAHPAGHDEAATAGQLKRTPAFNAEGLGHGRFEGAGDVRLGVVAGDGKGMQGAGLEPAEAEIKPGTIGHRTRKPIALRITALG
jgi:hypothetical protein